MADGFKLRQGRVQLQQDAGHSIAAPSVPISLAISTAFVYEIPTFNELVSIVLNRNSNP